MSSVRIGGIGGRKRGFASMDPERVREIASKGGKASHVQRRAHEFSSDEARVAGKKGGNAVHAKRRELEAAVRGEPKCEEVRHELEGEVQRDRERA